MKILMCVDLSKSTDEIVNTSLKFKNGLIEKLWILHIVESEPDFVGFGVGPQSVRNSYAKEFHDEHCQIQEIADKLRSIGLDTIAILTQGSTVETILKEAKNLKADMIILGSHGHGAVYDLLVGGVTEGVLRKSECPVLVVPTHD